jgi:beta-glucanase (GH16 family)
MRRVSILIYFACAGFFLASCSKGVSPGPSLITNNNTGPKIPVDSGWSFQTTPSFSDEFNYTGTPDTSKWTYDLGGGGWGNQELEYYTNNIKNVYVNNGYLYISAINQPTLGYAYTSARMVSKNAGTLTYGRIQVSAKLPSSPKGAWPAIWMLPNTYAYGNWPNSGEIDIMEQVSFDPLNVHFSLHNSVNYGANSHTETTSIPTDTSAFHTYQVDWTPFAVRGYYDGAQIFIFTNPGTGSNQWPFDQAFHLLMNIAIGGSWGGSQGVDPNVCPATMVVDYVRFYPMIHK